MTRTKVFWLLTSAVLLVGTVAIALSVPDYFSRWQPRRNPVDPKTPGVHLAFANGLDIVLLPLEGDHEPFVSESPITNAQYAVAVGEKGVPAPQLPNELGLAAAKQPPAAAVVDRARWEEVAWASGKYPEGQDSNAVLFVTLDEANAYCTWLERRFPKYHFRLPNFLERSALETEKCCQGDRPYEGESAFPRPTNGPKAIRIRDRFWLAPWTDELYVDVPWGDVVEEFKALDSYRNSPTRRYAQILGGSAGSASEIPTTFRVVAVIKQPS